MVVLSLAEYAALIGDIEMKLDEVDKMAEVQKNVICINEFLKIRGKR